MMRIRVLLSTALCFLVCAIPTFTRSLPPGYEPISGARTSHPNVSSIEATPADEQVRAQVSTTIANWLFPHQAVPPSRYPALAALARNGGLIKFGFGNGTPSQPRLAYLFHADPLPQLNDVVPGYGSSGVRHTSIMQSSSPSQATPPPSGDAADLAKTLTNPVASLISIPFQNNADFGMGPFEDGFRYTMNIQPVIPFRINDNWNLISRTILPIIHQNDVVARDTSQTGLGDITQSFFFSPTKTVPFIWAIGPVLLIPTATDHLLGTQKFGLGPTFLILKQQSGWTYGVLLNHIWSVAGADNRADVNSTFIQPFLSYTTRTAWTFSINTESSYDWTAEEWSIPIHFQISKLLKFGTQPVSFAAGPRCWANSPLGGPQSCGFRGVVTLLFPEKR